MSPPTTNTNDSWITPELRALYQKAVATPNAIIPAEKNLLRERPPPDEEERLCLAKVNLTLPQLHEKAIAHPEQLTLLEASIIMHGADYDPAQSRAAVDKFLQRSLQRVRRTQTCGWTQRVPLNQTVIDANWSQTCRLRPHCIIQPRNVTDVSVSIRIISWVGAKFTVRSGGHSPNPGASSIGEDGLLIDLSRLKTVTLSPDRCYARIGPGLRWNDVYAALDKEGTVVVGGRVPTVGVGGLILGGGYFFASNEVGLACDNVKNFEIVLSNGDIVNANAGTHSDLFWALKGGGPNFGIVTGYDLYTVPDVYHVWVELLIFPPDQATDVLDALAEWQYDGAINDIKSHTGLEIGLDVVSLGLFYTAPHRTSRPAAFYPFSKLTPLQVALPPTNMTLVTASRQ